MTLNLVEFLSDVWTYVFSSGLFLGEKENKTFKEPVDYSLIIFHFYSNNIYALSIFSFLQLFPILPWELLLENTNLYMSFLLETFM